MRARIILSFLFVSLALPLLAEASPLVDSGMQAMKNEHFSKAFGFFMRAAHEGDKVGERQLGLLYLKGLGVKKDRDRAVSWYLKAAKHGDAKAQFFLGHAYETGTLEKGDERNYKAALVWYEKAAEQGHFYAQLSAAILSCHDDLGVRDDKTCLLWFKKAANQGSITAQRRLFYWDNEKMNVELEADASFSWGMKLAKQGKPSWQLAIGKVFRYGTHGKNIDHQQAMIWYHKAASQDTSGLYSSSLALYYLEIAGKGDNERRKQGLIWFHRAAYLDKRGLYAAKLGELLMESGYEGEVRQAAVLLKKTAHLGYIASQATLGSMHLMFATYGIGNNADKLERIMFDVLYAGVTKEKQGYALADYWFKRVAKQDNSNKYHTQIMIAKLYHKYRDTKKTFYWYREAASRGSTVSQNKVGVMYELGIGVKRDIEQAKHWYLKAAESGNASAQNSLGFIYENVTFDDKSSKFWYEKAKAQGHPFASAKLK